MAAFRLSQFRQFAVRQHYPQWDTGIMAPTIYQMQMSFPMGDSEFHAPASSVHMFRNQFHQLKDARNLGPDIDPLIHPKREAVDHVLDLDWSLAGDPHQMIGTYAYHYTHYNWVREPIFPRTPNIERGEMATGAASYRTEVWKTADEPTVVSVARFTPDHFRAYDYESNAPMPATCGPPELLDFRQNRLPLGHADRRPFLYFCSAVTAAYTLAMIRGFVVKCIYSLWPSREAFSMGVIEVDLKKIRTGQNLLVKYRGKPVFISKRTQEAIEMAKSDDALIGGMRDPQIDSERALKAEFLIVIGVCTHLGCIPYADAGDFGGYFCPCHGSHYDTSGRVRKGPAPRNLEVPKHQYLDDFTVKIG